jgi:transposase-like protein
MEVSRLFMPDNNRIEQDHRAIKRRVRSMLGFKFMNSARAVLGGIEMVHMMRKQKAKYACNRQLSLAEQFDRAGSGNLDSGISGVSA